MRRRRGRGLVGVMATTAVVAGTAGAVHNHQENKQMAKQQAAYNDQQQVEMQAQLNAMQAQQANAAVQQAAPAAASVGLSEDSIAKLTQLSGLKDQGIITQEEFDRQKMILLG